MTGTGGCLLCLLLDLQVELLVPCAILRICLFINSRPTRFQHLDRDVSTSEWVPRGEHWKGDLCIAW